MSGLLRKRVLAAISELMVTPIIFLNEDHATLPFRKELLERLNTPSKITVIVAFKTEELLTADLESFGPWSVLLWVKSELVSLGPLHAASKSVCFSCLHYWLATTGVNRTEEIAGPGKAEAELSADLILQMIAADPSDLETFHNSLHVFDLRRDRHSVHPIYPLQNCSRCALMESRGTLTPMVHCSPVTGIVQKMEITTTPVAGAYRAIAKWVAPLPVHGARPLILPQDSHGRGRTKEEAKLGCLGEALERYSLIYRGDEALYRGRLDNFNYAVDPRKILLYSESQYASREQWNKCSDERYFIGEPFDAAKPIDWCPATNLANKDFALVPACITLMWYMSHEVQSDYAKADTIGCGSGRTLDDAVLHALLEWIERDAMAIWWYNKIRRPAVRLESFESESLLEVRNGLRAIERELILLDCTTDIGVPTFISIAPRKDGTEPLFAGASHLSPKIAAWKAASEVGEAWFTITHTKEIDHEMKNWLSNTMRTEKYLCPTHEVNANPEPTPMRPADAIASIVRRLNSLRLQAYVVDLSRPDVMLKTARVIVPGLRHIWNRRAPGRLYDVPVQLGWVERPLEEGELNSICCMI